MDGAFVSATVRNSILRGIVLFSLEFGEVEPGLDRNYARSKMIEFLCELSVKGLKFSIRVRSSKFKFSGRFYR